MKGINSISVLMEDEVDYEGEEKGVTTDYYTYKELYGNPIYRSDKRYVVFWTGKAYLKLGRYLEHDYFLALIEASDKIQN